MNVKVFVEGGGETKSLHVRCREGFRKLIERAGFAGRMPRLVACGNRNSAYDDFRSASGSYLSGDYYPMLLVDSEQALTSQSPWDHLNAVDGWSKPDNANDDQVQLMVQCMETWCVADRSALRSFFGPDLSENHLPALNDLESKPKNDVQEALVNATGDCGRKKGYRKGVKSFELIGHLDPAELRKHLPHFRRLCDALDKLLGTD